MLRASASGDTGDERPLSGKIFLAHRTGLEHFFLSSTSGLTIAFLARLLDIFVCANYNIDAHAVFRQLLAARFDGVGVQLLKDSSVAVRCVEQSSPSRRSVKSDDAMLCEMVRQWVCCNKTSSETIQFNTHQNDIPAHRSSLTSAPHEGPIQLVVEYRGCLNDDSNSKMIGHESLEGLHDVVGCTSYLGERLYLTTRPEDHHAAAQRVSALLADNKDLSAIFTFLESFKPPKAVTRSSAAQTKRHAMLGFAATYSPWHLQMFLSSLFRVINASVTTVFLFVDDPEAMRVSKPVKKWAHNPSLQFVATQSLKRVLTANCSWQESRFELYAEWLTSRRSREEEFDLVAFVDVRDVFFQRVDPFDGLIASRAWDEIITSHRVGNTTHRPGGEFLVAISEPYAPSALSSTSSVPIDLYQKWLDRNYGERYRKLVQATQLKATAREVWPILCSGLIVGTRRAMSYLARGMSLVLARRQGFDGSCHHDQAAFQMMILDGLRLSNFEGDIFVANGDLFPWRNGAARADDVYMRRGRLVNCLGEQYAMLHQLEPRRHPWALEALLQSTINRI